MINYSTDVQCYVSELNAFKFGIKHLKKQNGGPEMTNCLSKMHTIFVKIGKLMVLNSLILNFESKF